MTVYECMGGPKVLVIMMRVEVTAPGYLFYC